MTAVADWFVPLPPAAGGPVQMFAFPQAGGGCATFGRCAAALAGVADIWSVNLPGRQARFLEAPCTRIEPLVTQLADALPRFLDGRPFALVGYCTGALLGYLLARELQHRGQTPPAVLAVLSYPPPHWSRVDAGLLAAPPDEFWTRIVALGGVDERVAADATARELFEPALRADYAVAASFRPAPGPPLATGVSVIAGRADPLLDPGQLLEWAPYTDGDFRLSLVPGGHWLLEEDPALLAGRLARELSGIGTVPRPVA